MRFRFFPVVDGCPRLSPYYRDQIWLPCVVVVGCWLVYVTSGEQFLVCGSASSNVLRK